MQSQYIRETEQNLKFLETAHGKRQLKFQEIKPTELHQISLKVRNMSSGWLQ